MRIREVMTQSVVTAPPGATVREVAELMRERNVGSVVLVDDRGVACGFVTDRDLAVNVLAAGRDAGDRAIDHASAPVVTVGADADLQEAAETMVRHAIRRLPVVEEDRLTGIVTLDDLVVRTGDPELTHRITTDVTRAALPEFYFHQRGG